MPGKVVASVSIDGAIDEEWQALIDAEHKAELEAIIEGEQLRADATFASIGIAFRDGALRTTRTTITKVLPPASRFSADGGHRERKQRVIEKLGAFFERFLGLSSPAEIGRSA